MNKHRHRNRAVLNGLRLTPQRLAILTHLEASKGHPSVDEVYKAVSRRFPTISLATVYNTLELLKDRGVITELAVDAGKKRFDPDPRPHHHLICVECKSIRDVFEVAEPDLPEARQAGFKITSSQIEFFGICAECRSE